MSTHAELLHFFHLKSRARWTKLFISFDIFGTLILLGIFLQSSLSQTVRNIHVFTSSDTSKPPGGSLVQGRDGNLYGPAGGGSGGTIFKITPAGVPSTLFVYDYANNPANGSGPSGFTLGSDGNFYGTTVGGGISFSGGGSGGVLFRMTPTGIYTVLHSFSGGADGQNPVAPPIEASDGSLYGTTQGSGLTGATVYRYTRSGSYSSIYQFDGTHGLHISAPLIQDQDGHLLGTAYDGGANGCGAIFKMSTSGAVLKSYSFPCHHAGANPLVALIQASDGDFYGTTVHGGPSNRGTIFRMTPTFRVSILYSFQGISTDGTYPEAALVQATDGNLYGSTFFGPANLEYGTLFQISTAGTYQYLYGFTPAVGLYPASALVQHTDGLLYGTVDQGAANGLGAVFTLDMGLGPFVTFVRANGRIGQIAQILGQGLRGTTEVTFNGISATSFVVGSDTYIRAVIPSGATTGPVMITTPKGTLTSNKNFRIVP